MANLASHYIDTIFTTISRLLEYHRNVAKVENKKIRRTMRARRHSTETGGGMVPMGDARVEASKRREVIILSLLKTIDDLLDTAQRKHQVSYKKGLARRDYIEIQLKSKYTNSWRSGLSNRYG